ncbi:hypothetical protein EV426DRAFT_426425 [Tirmania nivea]|nr:hypothetical protein EV426DRAFT_426425 [Tirmania nivea]
MDSLARALCPTLTRMGRLLQKGSKRLPVKCLRAMSTEVTQSSLLQEVRVPLVGVPQQQGILSAAPGSLPPQQNQKMQPTQAPSLPRRSAKSKLKEAPPPLPPSIITTQLPPEDATILSPVITHILHRRYPAVFQTAFRIVHAHPHLLNSAATYSLLIEACSLFPGSLMQEIAWSLYNEMQSRGIRPTSSIYHHLLRLLASSPDYIKRAQILQEMKARWFTVTDEGWEWVIKGLFRDGQYEAALEVVEKRVNEGKGFGREAWEEVVVGLAKAGEVEEAWRWMIVGREQVRSRWEAGEDVQKGWEMGNRAWYELCAAAAKALHRDATLWSWRYILTQNLFPPDDGLLHLLLDVATRYSIPTLASQVLRFLSRREVPFMESHYQALIQMYLTPSPTNVPSLSRALSVLQLMRRAGVPSSGSTVKAMAECLRRWGEKSLDDGVKEIKEWLAEGWTDELGEGERDASKREVDSVVFDAIIAAYTRFGVRGLKKAWGVYKLTSDLGVKPTQRTFNYLLTGAAIPSPREPQPEEQGGSNPEALKKKFAMYLILEMADKKNPHIYPSITTYESLIVLCLNHVVRLVPEKFYDPAIPMPYPATRAPRHTRRPPWPPLEETEADEPERESLDDAFEYLFEMLFAGGYRPRQWLLRRVLECCMRRDDERTGWVLEEMERWGYWEDMGEERELVAGFWRRVPVDVSDGRGTAPGGEWGWVRCGRRSRREGGVWKVV